MEVVSGAGVCKGDSGGVEAELNGKTCSLHQDFDLARLYDKQWLCQHLFDPLPSDTDLTLVTSSEFMYGYFQDGMRRKSPYEIT